MRDSREGNCEILLSSQPFKPLLTPFLSPPVGNQRHLLRFLSGDGDNVFLHGIIDGLVNRRGVCQWMAKVINAKSALANFPAEAHDEEDALHDGCNEEHDPTCTNVRTGVIAMDDDRSYPSNLYLAWIEVSHALD